MSGTQIGFIPPLCKLAFLLCNKFCLGGWSCPQHLHRLIMECDVALHGLTYVAPSVSPNTEVQTTTDNHVPSYCRLTWMNLTGILNTFCNWVHTWQQYRGDVAHSSVKLNVEWSPTTVNLCVIPSKALTILVCWMVACATSNVSKRDLFCSTVFSKFHLWNKLKLPAMATSGWWFSNWPKLLSSMPRKMTKLSTLSMTLVGRLFLLKAVMSSGTASSESACSSLIIIHSELTLQFLSCQTKQKTRTKMVTVTERPAAWWIQ